MRTTSDLLDDFRAHDALLRARGYDVWVGAEPTFSDRSSQEPWWLNEAEGGDKEARARDLVIALAPKLSGQVSVQRSVGRAFPDEPKPRFCFSATWPRTPRLVEPSDLELSKADLVALDGEPLPRGPIDTATTAHLTVTPDPGVIEINMAPAATIETFLAHARAVYDAAHEVGLSSVRYLYNGTATDSGGGGQITFGGPSPSDSPFFRHVHLLPGLLRYLNRHPSLSYWFAMDCIGSAGQGPRPDEGVRELFEELSIAVDRFSWPDAPSTPEGLWSAFAPLLVDGSGNSHRAEVNIEKLWNPWLAERGCLGLVEFRALRMPRTAEHLAANAALLRALIARLIARPYSEPLVDWGRALHDRFALPTFVEDDLRAVLDDLDACGFGLGLGIRGLLLEGPDPVAEAALEGAVLEVKRAREFWPLVGDVASQERRGARLVDASTERLEVRIVVPDGGLPGFVTVNGWHLALRRGTTREGRTPWVAGIRRRAFVPKPGLHPGLPIQDPLELVWSRGARSTRITLHGWIPGGGSYPGLPDGPDEALRRRRERVLIEVSEGATQRGRLPPMSADEDGSPRLCLDLRRLPPTD